MSDAPASTRKLRLPAWAAPRAQADGGDPAGHLVRWVETAAAIAIGLVLAVAVVHDVARQVRINKRVSADKQTWLAYAVPRSIPYAQSQYKRLGVRLLERGTTDFVCQPTALTHVLAVREQRLCLMVSGPVRSSGTRTIDGGYYVLPSREDRYANRYRCFGLMAQRHECGLKAIPAPLR
jgi:hypothetical protein